MLVRVARQPGREHRRRRSGLMNSVRLTRRNLALIVILAVAAIIIGAAVCVHFFRIPKLSTLGARLRSPGTLALADPGPQDLPCASADDEPSQPIETTVCAVVQHPDRFACKRIRFRAALSTDCLENSVLVAEGCARGIVPWGSPNPEADRFFEGACMGHPSISTQEERRRLWVAFGCVYATSEPFTFWKSKALRTSRSDRRQRPGAARSQTEPRPRPCWANRGIGHG